MTNYEFDVEYDKLKKVHPRFYNKGDNRRVIFNAVQGMGLKWFKEVVQKVIANPTIKISIVQEVANYKAMQRRVQEARQIMYEDERRDPNAHTGLKDYLNGVGATSAVDAISKHPKVEDQGEEIT